MARALLFLAALVVALPCARADVSRRHVLVIVVDNVGGDSKLPQAVENGIELKNTLAKLDGVTVKGTSFNEGREAIARAVQNLAAGAGSDDGLTLYYLGHGFKSGGSSYWATVDTRADAGRPTSTEGSISTEDLYNWLKGTKASEIVVFNDACRNLAAGAVSGDGWNGFASRLAAAVPPGADKRRVLVVHATRDNEVGLSHPDAGGSLLCRFVIEAAQGRAGKFADLDREGSEVRTPRLQEYVSERYKSFRTKFRNARVEPEFEAANLPGDGLHFCGTPERPEEFVRPGTFDRDKFWKSLNAFYGDAASKFRTLAGAELQELNVLRRGRPKLVESKRGFPGAEATWLVDNRSGYTFYAVLGLYPTENDAYGVATKFCETLRFKEAQGTEQVGILGGLPDLSKIDLGDVIDILGGKSRRPTNANPNAPKWMWTKERFPQVVTLRRRDQNGASVYVKIGMVEPTPEYLLVTQRIANLQEAQQYQDQRILLVTIQAF
ncbi:MAG: caspase family protein [Fimbriimonadaceae bacterium]|nr:caspase family protein [Fimbriimonadaceae bacterium]